MANRATVIVASAVGATLITVGAAFATVSAMTSSNASESRALAGGSETGLPSGVATEEPPAKPDPTPSIDPATLNKRIPRTFQISTKQPVFFITIDDGVVKSQAALDVIRQYQIPVTVFLTEVEVAGQWNYFKKVASYGGTVENHTYSHKSLTSSSTSLETEICKPQQAYAEHFGAAPTVLRPPYGNGGYSNTPTATRKKLDRVARSCGISNIVMWNAVAGPGKIDFIRGSLTRGDIVLFHFTDDLANELRSVMSMAAKKGLHPAPLMDYLP